ncbi:MAG: hypothetical protein O2887_08095 [Bacteroidetes bacterium]|nr:hypothetical protein [Bacteroidota bacterium]MDA1120440.1 hypothetical protein [Bacteroidota bacterium]
MSLSFTRGGKVLVTTRASLSLFAYQRLTSWTLMNDLYSILPQGPFHETLIGLLFNIDTSCHYPFVPLKYET